MTESFPPLNIAIIGAGIAGLTTEISLLPHPHLTLTIYERATILAEIGASIALGPNGLRTLERLGLHNAISDDIAFRGPSDVAMIYRHWKTNEVIGQDVHVGVKEHLHQTARYHRAHLHSALLENVPEGMVRLGKKVVSAEIGEEGVRLGFEDGTEVIADLVLGADGIHSGLRQALVPDFKLQWSGWTAFRSCFDASRTHGIPSLPADSTHWWGPETTFFSSKLGKNQYTIVGGIYKDPSVSSLDIFWDEEANVKLLRDIYSNWNPAVKGLTEITPSIRYYPNYTCTTSLPTWNFGNRITFLGDAAHAHGGAHATGGSVAIDDAYAFSLALNEVFPFDATRKPTIGELGRALELYEATRKPHAERLLGVVRAANIARAARVGHPESDEALRERAARGSNTGWLHEHDVVKAFEETKRRFEEADVDGEISLARL